MKKCAHVTATVNREKFAQMPAKEVLRSLEWAYDNVLLSTMERFIMDDERVLSQVRIKGFQRQLEVLRQRLLDKKSRGIITDEKYQEADLILTSLMERLSNRTAK